MNLWIVKIYLDDSRSKVISTEMSTLAFFRVFQGSRIKYQSIKYRGSRIKYKGSSNKDQGSSIKDQVSRIKYQGSSIKYQVSSIKYQGSSIKDQYQGSSITWSLLTSRLACSDSRDSSLPQTSSALSST